MRKETNVSSLIRDLNKYSDGAIHILQEMLREGMSPSLCARKIQHEWGALTHIKESTLTSRIKRYRDEILVDVNEIIVPEDPESDGRAKRLREQLDVMDELQELVLMQKERLRLIIDKEQTLKMPFNWAGKEVSLMAELLAQLAKHQFDVGSLRFMGPLPVTHTRTVSLEDGTTMSESSTHMSSVLDRAIKLINETTPFPTEITEGEFKEKSSEGDLEKGPDF